MHPIHALRAERHAHSRALRALEELTLALPSSKYIEEECPEEKALITAINKAMSLLEEKRL